MAAQLAKKNTRQIIPNESQKTLSSHSHDEDVPEYVWRAFQILLDEENILGLHEGGEDVVQYVHHTVTYHAPYVAAGLGGDVADLRTATRNLQHAGKSKLARA